MIFGGDGDETDEYDLCWKMMDYFLKLDYIEGWQLTDVEACASIVGSSTACHVSRNSFAPVFTRSNLFLA